MSETYKPAAGDLEALAHHPPPPPSALFLHVGRGTRGQPFEADSQEAVSQSAMRTGAACEAGSVRAPWGWETSWQARWTAWVCYAEVVGPRRELVGPRQGWVCSDEVQDRGGCGGRAM